MSRNSIKDNISKFASCYGCGVCIAACPAKIIDFQENEDGFYSPVIVNQEKCTNCGICLDVCGYNHSRLSLSSGNEKSYAGWSNDSAIRKVCSSGGIAFEICKELISEGYKICAVRYNAEKHRAEHYVAESYIDLIPSIGSKYLQSFSADGFKAIDKLNGKYAVIGTPCQIESFRRFVRRYKIEERFILIDFFCHGVPSQLLWERYIFDVEKVTGEITNASWRNKSTSWNGSWAISLDEIGQKRTGSNAGKDSDWHGSYQMLIKGGQLYNSKLSEGDLFYKFFLGDLCLNQCCYEACKYKGIASFADIRIGDLWGHKYKSNVEGVSGIIAFTSKGKKIIDDLSKMCEIDNEPIKIVTEGQMLKSPSIPSIRSFVLEQLRTKKSLKEINECKKLQRFWRNKRLKTFMIRVKLYLKRIIGL